ncbi:MAG: ATP-binding protein [Bacteroidales bacterium]|nr:ATP-binding protein [Bacteroidales bacterium]
MIHSLSIKNYLSFKDEVIFSFEASKDSHLEEHHVVEVAKGVRLLKFGIVYGYNASGKSNLINAFEFLHDFWFKTVDNKHDSVGVIPFMLDKNHRNKPTSFKLVFYINDLRHAYSVQIFDNIVLNERLEYYPGTQPAVIFERKDSEGISKIDFGYKIKVGSVAKDEISIKCLSNISLFAAYNQVNAKIREIDSVIEWMNEKVMQSIEPGTKLQNYTESLVFENNILKTKVLEYLQRADFNISNIISEVTEEEVPEELILRAKELGIPIAEIDRLEKERTIKITNTEFEHLVINDNVEETYNLPIDLQSAGTKRIFGLSGAIFQTLKRDAFLPIDELEAKLHPKLIEYVIEKFLRESDNSQLLVTTHYDNLFDEDDLLRKDNFWFTEKGDDGATKLYPLSSFKGLGRISSLQKAYKFGKFGSIPNFD